ncbi:steroid hormone receptor ERR2 isoform X2 [Bemisia tabaci]|uniref:steroid hormone receptor ERR2 isoform X2 n=2 Tax=Bemisia tabaci TaxID=7038 RepID=UPI0008F9D4F1|nr:PREDICTED: steroid hormone receptor ERR1 isoform X2 [Bemisia tabaci]XP_018913852.1 PREDICTED: steroid hormone receptor ERR1 isoform X2 [Bemisia tabaci]XP_018913863.1 PREDICTED: steroid hormone receptor ERR1 isoform X2 [Bemisia tabaci]
MMEHVWMEDMVSMMSEGPPVATAVGATNVSEMVIIKKEIDGSGRARAGGLDCSPPDNSTALQYSPTTTSGFHLHTEDTKYSEEHYGAPSPGSPDHQYCSSTTQSLGDPLLDTIDERIKEEDIPRRLCLVCGDVASGFHYGVASCEACKAFFKRTIQGNIEYTCPATNDCEINKRRRKACQACRFQKCLRMGMLKEGVRLDRVRGGRQKYRRNPELPQPVQPWHQIMNTPSLEDNKMLEALTQCEPDMLSCLSSSSLAVDILSILSDLYDRELVGTIGWAKQIPGFTDLSLNDQMRLLQASWAEILTLTLSYRSLPLSSGKLRFATDFTLDELQARDCGAFEIYQLCLQVIERLERLSIAKEEYYLLKALVLANSDVRLDELVSLKKFRDNILSALGECVFVIRPNMCVSHTQNLLLCLPILRQADQVIRRFWSSVHKEGKVLMNKLFVEMLEACLH